MSITYLFLLREREPEYFPLPSELCLPVSSLPLLLHLAAPGLQLMDLKQRSIKGIKMKLQ